MLYLRLPKIPRRLLDLDNPDAMVKMVWLDIDEDL
jgi:hypothetical protein